MDGVNKRKIWVTLFPLEGAPAFDFFFSFLLVGFKKKTNLDMSEAWVVDLSTPLRVTPFFCFFLCYIQSQTCYHRWANVFWWTPIKSPHTEWHRAKLTDYQKRPKLRDFFFKPTLHYITPSSVISKLDNKTIFHTLLPTRQMWLIETFPCSLYTLETNGYRYLWNHEA